MTDSSVPSVDVIRTGTDVPDSARSSRVLRAGPLTVELDSGNLRYIRIGGVEVLRALAFLVRDENWGTYVPRIDDLRVEEHADGFSVEYRAHCERGGQSLTYHARIRGASDGSLTFDGDVHAHTDFLTARTGFVVLHPLKGVVGEPVKVEHVDGRIETSRFPQRIDPVQPFRDIRALAHEVAPGVWANVRMEGDTFEMEDHRNWTDASFKTYVRPLALPWPYVLAAGSDTSQRVTLKLDGALSAVPQAASAGDVEIAVGRATTHAMPEIGLGVPAEEVDHSIKALPLLEVVAPQALVLQFDPRKGHDTVLLKKYRKLVDALACQGVLEIVLPNVASPSEELRAVARQVEEAKLRLAAVAVSPAPHLKSVLPGAAFPPCATFEDIYLAARSAFPALTLGGGMFSFFTELNRKRPNAGLLDFVSHTTCPIVHACDDRSVMETLEALPFVIESAKAIAQGKPYRVGPSSIGPRDNPHGATTADNPDNGRVCLAKVDPRQRGLFAGAWILGYVAAFARGGAQMVTLGSPTGPAGIVHRRQDHAQPWYDTLRGPSVYPAFHVVSGLARAAGTTRLAADSSEPAAVAVLAHRVNGGIRLWFANLGTTARTVRVHGLPAGGAKLRILDESTFASAASNDTGFAEAACPWSGTPVELGAYAVACIEAMHTEGHA